MLPEEEPWFVQYLSRIALFPASHHWPSHVRVYPPEEK